MVPYLWISLLILMITSPLAMVKHVQSADWRYEACKPRNCGTGPDIRFPFYISDPNSTDDSPCGYPGFDVCCQDNKPMFSTSKSQFVIQSISYENRTFRLVDLGLFGNSTCIEPSFFAFDRSSLQFGADVLSVCLLYNCSKSFPVKYMENPILCATNDSYNGYAAVDNGEDGIVCEDMPCESYVASPFDSAAGSNLSATSRVNYTRLLENGFSLTWEGLNCKECEKSGGFCGFDGNQTLCYCPDQPHSHSCKNGKSKLGAILGAVGGGIFILVSGFVAFLLWRCKKGIDAAPFLHSRHITDPSIQSDAECGSVYFGVPVFSYKELEEVTNHFHESNELGNGGFGTVYYGKLKDGREVAVKYLFEHNFKRMQQFKNEIAILTRLRHRNLVTLYGCTSSRSRDLLLVYEYIPNGTLADHLHGDRAKDKSLTWPVRMNIAIDTAGALAYLHASDIIHRDVKTNNILLDLNFCVKVADFGLSRLFPNDITHISTAPQGTPGYVDPEYHHFYQLTDKSDVYSFGVVLIELISSMPAVDMSRNSYDINLSNFALSRIQKRAFNELIDPCFQNESDPEVERMTTSVAELAFRCLQHEKDMRPTMEEVLETLKAIQSNEDNTTSETTTAENENASAVQPKTSTITPSPESEYVVLLKKKINLPSSPNSVTDTWTSGSSTGTSR